MLASALHRITPHISHLAQTYSGLFKRHKKIKKSDYDSKDNMRGSLYEAEFTEEGLLQRDKEQNERGKLLGKLKTEGHERGERVSYLMVHMCER